MTKEEATRMIGKRFKVNPEAKRIGLTKIPDELRLGKVWIIIEVTDSLVMMQGEDSTGKATLMLKYFEKVCLPAD